MTPSARIRWVLACAIILLCRFDHVAQNLRVDVVLQQVIATVRDSDGKLVTNLQPEDFIVELNGVRQPIAHLRHDADVPISVGLLIDASQSMEAALTSARGAAATFIRGMRVRDESFLMTFAGGAKLHQDFTNEPALLFDALRRVSIGPGSAVIESVRRAVEKLSLAKNPKRALIVISDGGDIEAMDREVRAFHEKVRTMETLLYSVQLQDAQEAARLARVAAMAEASGGIVYSRDPTAAEHAVHPPPGPRVRSSAAFRPELAHKLMEGMAAESGANYFYLDSNAAHDRLSRQMSLVFNEVFTELRSQYTIGFYPSSGAPASSPVRVRMVNESYRVRTLTTKMGTATEISNDEYETTLQAAQDYQRQGHFAEAIQAYERASTLKPSDPRVYRELGTIYAHQKQFQKAADALNRLQALGAMTGAERYLFGAVLYELNDASGAIEQCTQAIRLIPDNPQPHLLLYSVYMKQNKPHEALNILERYLIQFPHDSNRELAARRARELRAVLRNPPN